VTSAKREINFFFDVGGSNGWVLLHFFSTYLLHSSSTFYWVKDAIYAVIIHPFISSSPFYSSFLQCPTPDPTPETVGPNSHAPQTGIRIHPIKNILRSFSVAFFCRLIAVLHIFIYASFAVLIFLGYFWFPRSIKKKLNINVTVHIYVC
jgi:hypothetical protein